MAIPKAHSTGPLVVPRAAAHRLLLSGAAFCLWLGRLALHTTHALSIGFGYLRADDGSGSGAWVTMGYSARDGDTEESPTEGSALQVQDPSLVVVHSPCTRQGCKITHQ